MKGFEVDTDLADYEPRIFSDEEAAAVSSLGREFRDRYPVIEHQGGVWYDQRDQTSGSALHTLIAGGLAFRTTKEGHKNYPQLPTQEVYEDLKRAGLNMGSLALGRASIFNDSDSTPWHVREQGDAVTREKTGAAVLFGPRGIIVGLSKMWERRMPPTHLPPSPQWAYMSYITGLTPWKNMQRDGEPVILRRRLATRAFYHLGNTGCRESASEPRIVPVFEDVYDALLGAMPREFPSEGEAHWLYQP